MHMKLNFKRLMAMLLSIMMVVGLLPTMVFAEDASELHSESITVAEVNGNQYADISEAINAAAEANGTVTLIADADIKGVAIGENANVTLDLNGKNLTLTSPSFGAHALTVKGELTINGEGNVKVMPFANLALGIKVETNGTLTINGGNFSADKGNIGSVNGELIINGGKFTCPSNTSLFNTGNDINLTITGGEFSHAPFEERENDNRDISITGGTYGEDEVPDEWIVPGFELNEDGEVVEAAPVYVAKIGKQGYASLAEALEAAKNMTGDVVVEINDMVTLNAPFNGAYDSITFVGKDTDAEIYLEVQGYITASDKKVAFEDLKLSKSEGGFITNAGFMNVAFGVYEATEVTYTDCTFANGAYASSGDVTFTGCTFKRSYDKYGLWAYGNVDVTVDECTFADYRGIKMYAENGANDSVAKANLTVKNTNFSAVNNKPAIVLTYGESVTLEDNTYSSTGVFELDLDGKPNGVAVASDVAPTCVNDNGACGVLVDGKIYTTVAQAAEVATSGSKVTLLHNSTETVEFAEGVILDKNGYTADGVTVYEPITASTGSNSPAYTKEVDGCVRVWGEGGGNAKESFVLKLYSEDTLIATTTLNNVGGIIDGDVWVTWNFFYPSSNDEYWTTTWEEGHPKAEAQPTKVELIIDGTVVATTSAQMNGADGINPVVWAELGGVAPTLPEVIEISTWDDLKALDARVEGGDMLEGVIVKLMNDIDLYEMGTDGEPVTFNPIGANKAYFKGTFDGQGYTIKNMFQSGWALGYDWDHYGTIGLFAYLWDATVKNLTVENAECYVEGGNVAGIAGCAWGDCTFENITIKNSTYATYNNRAAGIVGYTGGEGTMTFKNIIVDGNTVIAGLWGSFDSSLGGVVASIQDPTKHVFENVTVACRLDAYNDVTAAYKYYAYRMCGMLIGRIPVDGNNQPILDNVTIGENVVLDYSNTPDYSYTNASGSWKRVEAGYAYDGVDLTEYPDAEVLYKPANSIFGGQQYGSYGQDDHDDIVALGRVAAFDGEYFTSLENAIKAADGAKDSEGNDIPVKLMADYSNDIVITESLNLDLNGYSFTGNVTTGDGYEVVKVENSVYTVVEKAVVLSGSGTAEDPYLITNIEELEAFRNNVNKGNTYAGQYIKLTADIDLTGKVWVPIGTSNYDKTPKTEGVKMFAGNFDGGNHTITGLTSNGYVPDAAETGSTEYSFGLFGYVYGANISNVKLVNVDIDCGTRTDSAGNKVYGSGIAALIGYYVPANEKTSVISNCHVLSGTVKASNNMGGLIGHMDSQLSQPKVDITIKNCSNAAAVTTEAREAGGILGLMNSAREGNYLVTMRGTVTFKNCVNTGNITSLGGGAPSAGGILGRDHNQAAGQRLKIVFDSCENSGTITVTANGETHAAGIGAGYYSTGAWLIAKDCTNTGNVVVNGSGDVYAGGLISYGGVVELINSTSTGTVTGGNGNKYVGSAASILFLNEMDDYADTITGNTYYLNGGTSPEYSALVDDAAHGGNFHLVETAYKDGYEFGGWYDNPEFDGEAYTALAAGVKTYYAKWLSNNTTYEVSNKAELDAALAAAQDGDVIVLTADIDYGTTQLAIAKAITLDLGGKTLTTSNAYGGMSLKNNPTIKNGTIVHASNTAAIKVWNATAFEDLVIDVQGKGDANKTIGGIVLQSGSTTHVGYIKNVTIKGEALTNGIETYNCGDATENVIGSMENVTIDAVGTGMLISAPCGTATNCSISGGVNGIELWIKGNYSASLELADSTVTGGVYAHDEFNSNAGVVNSGTLSLTTSGTTDIDADDITLTLARAENVEGLIEEVKDNAVAKVDNTYYATFTDALTAVKADSVLELLADVTIANPISVTGNLTINGNGKTLTYTGSNRAMDIPSNANAKVNLTINQLTVDCTASYCERGISYNEDGALTLNTVTVKGTNVTYALNLPGSSDNTTVVINDSALSGNIALNVWGENATITANNTVFTSVDKTDVENYSAIALNNDGTTIANGTIVTINGGEIIALDENGEPSYAVRNSTASGEVIVSESTVVNGETVAPVALVTYEGYSQFYSFTTLQKAIDKAIETNGKVELLTDITASEIITINGSVVIDGKGHTLTSTAARAINVSRANGVTIKNLTINASGERAINVIKNATNVTIDNVTATAANYTVNVAASAPNAVVAINNSTLNGLCTVNVAGAGATVTVDNSTVNCNDNNTTAGESYAALALNKEAVGASIVATNTTVNVAEGSDSVKGRNGAENGTVTINGSTDDVKVTVAVITYAGQDSYHGFYSLAEAFKFAKNGDTITLIRNVEQTETITVNKNITLELNGNTISGTNNASQGHLFMVNNAVTLTIKDGSTEQTGKITYAGSNSTGWIIDVEGALVLESGTLELTGTWSIGYAVDVRPNAWGTAYTAPTTFTMNGGKIVSSDGAVRVASSSADKYSNISASFTMNDGEIEAAWDGVFVQQSNAAWDVLNVTINGGTIKSGLNPIRFYGPAATSYVNGEDCVDITLNGGTLTYTGTETREWLVDGILRIGGGVTADDVVNGTTVTASAAFANANVADGYEWVAGANGMYELAEVESVAIVAKSATLLYEDMIQIRYKFEVTGKDIAEYGMFVFTNEADADAHDASKAVQHKELEYKVIDGSEGYFGYTDGIVAKEMGDSQFVVGYVKLSDDTYVYGDTVEYSPRIYAQRMVGKESTSEETKALCNALMAYGAAAQKYLNYKTNELMNVGFDDVAFNDSVLGQSVFAVDTTETNGFTTKSATLIFEGAITYRIRYTANNSISGKNLYVEYTIKGKTESVALTPYGTAGNYEARIDGIAAKDMDETITVRPYYVDNNGDKVYGAELVYSGYEYSRRTINTSSNANSIDLAKNFAMYVYAANNAIK